MTVTCAKTSPTFTSAWVSVEFNSSTYAVCMTGGGVRLVQPVLSCNQIGFLDVDDPLITDTGMLARWMSPPTIHAYPDHGLAFNNVVVWRTRHSCLE